MFVIIPFSKSYPSTTCNAANEQQTFKIVHQFHPSYGREYEVLAHKQNWGEDRVSYVDEAGKYHCIPANWTNIDLPNPFERYDNNKVYFRIFDLIELKNIISK